MVTVAGRFAITFWFIANDASRYRTEPVGTEVFHTCQTKLEWYETSGGSVDIAWQKMFGTKAHDRRLGFDKIHGR